LLSYTYDPTKVDDCRRIRELEVEVERLKLLVAELLLAKKRGAAQAAGSFTRPLNSEDR
jgi:hypothetical protein